jgi:MFS transporter, putative metabolite transport protein
MIIALGGVFVDAYDMTSLSVGAIQLRDEFHLSGTQVGLLSSTMAISALFGALVGGYFVDKLGRKRMFLLDLWLFVLSAIGAALAPNLTVLIVFRLLMGLGVGLDFPVALSFLAEFSNRAKRGLSVNFSYLNWNLAAIVGFVASLIGYEVGAGVTLWRVAVGFGAVPALILLALRYRYMLESPLWAAHQGDLEEAARILRRTRNLTVVVEPQSVVPEASRPKPRAIDIAHVIFSRHYRRRAILAAVIASLQSVQYYSVIFYLPIISQVIFGESLVTAILGAILFNAVGLIGSTFQALVCDRTGIRPLTLVGSFMTVFALLGTALAHANGILVIEGLMVGLFMIGHTIGPGPQGMAFGTLSFPTAIRGSAVGWTQGMLRLGSFFGFLFFPMVKSAFGFSITFAVMAAIPFVIGVTTLLIRWEPIGVDIEAEPIDRQTLAALDKIRKSPVATGVQVTDNATSRDVSPTVTMSTVGVASSTPREVDACG